MKEIDSIVMYLIISFILNFQMKYPFTHFFIFYVFYVSSSYDVSFSFSSFSPFSLNSYIPLLINLILHLILRIFLIIQIYPQVIRNLKSNQVIHSVQEVVIHLIKFFYDNLTYLSNLALDFYIKYLKII